MDTTTDKRVEAPQMNAEEMLTRLRHVLADVQAKGRHARESAERLRAGPRWVLESKTIQMAAYEAGAKWADEHAAALEQAIKGYEVLTAPGDPGITHYISRPRVECAIHPAEGGTKIFAASTLMEALLKAHAALYPSTPSPEKGEDAP